ncbi:MAG: DUF389 domain-containing protein [Bacteroidota bacterium]
MTSPQPPNSLYEPERHSTAASAARRRRARRQIMPVDAEGRAALVASLARRAYPTYEFFIFAVLCGAVLGLGFLLDSPPVLLFGILLAPLMTPWVGMILALISGSARFFIETLVAILVTSVLVFLTGFVAGLAARAFLPRTFTNAFFHSQLWLPWLIALAVSSALLVVSFVRSEAKPFLPSVMLAYSLFTPISAAAFGLGSGIEGVWQRGLLVFAVHLGLATLVGLFTFLALRFRPTAGGVALSGAVTVLIAGALVFLMVPGLGGAPPAAQAPPTQAASLEPPTEAPVVDVLPSPTQAASKTPHVQTATPARVTPVPLTLAVTLPATETPTITLTFEPTPVYARIGSDTGGGVNLRKTPNGTYIATLDNGSTVEVQPEVQEVSGTAWAHVIAVKNGKRLEGWILQSVLVMATPVPNWQPSSTPALGATLETTTPVTALP